jgi:hypothetical protein
VCCPSSPSVVFSQIYLACVSSPLVRTLANSVTNQIRLVCVSRVRLGLQSSVTSQIYLACVARSLPWPSNSKSDLKLSSTCSVDLSVLEEFPDDVPVVISLYDLLEALASRNSSCRPHLVLSNDIQPHLRGVPPVLYDLLEALAFRNSSCRFLLVLSNDIQTHLRGVPPVYASIALSPNTFPATSTPGS